jgi:nucleotide-binding universal stress UspA family protein
MSSKDITHGDDYDEEWLERINLRQIGVGMLRNNRYEAGGLQDDNRQFPKSKGILLAVDGSPSAKATAYAAVQIASEMQWCIQALYVVDVSQVFNPYNDISKELSELGEEMPYEQKETLFEEQGTLALAEIEELCQQMKVPVTTEMVFGDVSDTILEASEGYNLLAIGHMGNRHAKENNHLGSNFQQIAHHAHIPLLIGGSHCTSRKVQHVLLAYDGSQLSHEAFKWVENLHGLFKTVKVLSVEREKERNHAWLAERHEEIEESTLTQYEFVRGSGNPGHVIASKASAEHVDLILMGAYRHKNLLRWVRHSTIDTVLRETDLPVLAIK